MPSSLGFRNTAKDSLVFSIDTHDTSNCVTPLGCGGFNTSTQGIKNILTGTTALFQNGLRISNRDFYTAFAIDYPEGSYGGDAANRQGITPGYNVRSGGKTYDASRSLHLWVWNNDTNTWVADSFFRGLRLNGHCYDNYSGYASWPAEIGLFVADFNIIKQAFPNCTYIVLGSHRADSYNSTLRNILWDLGMPAGYLESDYVAAPEWILVGKPGLGKGNAYGWSYENYPTNPNQVAHMNLSVTPKSLGILSFDGTDDFFDLPTSAIPTGYLITIELVTKGINSYPNASIITGGSAGNQDLNIHLPWSDTNIYWDCGRPFNRIFKSVSPSELTGPHHWVFTKNASTGIMNIYLDGNLWHTGGGLTSTIPAMGVVNLGRYNIGSGGLYYYNASLSVLNIYNKDLSPSEILRNYNSYKRRNLV
jgi:hypothetical protein